MLAAFDGIEILDKKKLSGQLTANLEHAGKARRPQWQPLTLISCITRTNCAEKSVPRSDDNSSRAAKDPECAALGLLCQIHGPTSKRVGH